MGRKSADGALQRFDKSLEEFYALCDQLELCLVSGSPSTVFCAPLPPIFTSHFPLATSFAHSLSFPLPPGTHSPMSSLLTPPLQRLAHECLSQSFDSAKHAPALVPAAPKGEGAAGESLPYNQYLPLIKAQIAGAKDIHNALLEGANKITGKLPPTGGP